MRIDDFMMSPAESYRQSLVNNDPIAKAVEANVARATGVDKTGAVGESEKTSGPGAVQKGECQTCKNRKYVDGSDEMVSFKSPTHVSPGAAGGAVRAHEQEHVSNAYAKANEGGGKVLRASVSIYTSICPECGRVYVSGGLTRTAIAYSKDGGAKKGAAGGGKGQGFDASV